jgi:hypothetical protein
VPTSNRTYTKYQQFYIALGKAIERYRAQFAGCNVSIGDVRNDLATGDAEDVIVPLIVSHLPNAGHFERYLCAALGATTYLRIEQELSGGKAAMRYYCHIDRKQFRNRAQWCGVLQHFRPAIVAALATFFLLYFFMYLY